MHRTFTSSGLKPGSIQRNPPQVTRFSFSKISKFEELYLFGHPDYAQLSREQQEEIQREAQEAFFAWMMSMRYQGKTTTPLQKDKMYNEIVQKLIAFLELTEVAKPAFGGDGGFDLQAPSFESVEPRQCLSPFDGLSVTGVIPFSQPIPQSAPNPELSNSAQFHVECNGSDNEEGGMQQKLWMPFSEPLSPILESLSFMKSLDSSLPLILQTKAVDHESHEMPQEQPLIPSEVFGMLEVPGVTETLREISAIHARISSFLNEVPIDITLVPCDWLQSEYPFGAQDLIRSSEQ